MTKITRILAREILDSRGNPTLETTVWAGEKYAYASVPSGASTGSHEAFELRDGDKKHYGGLGVKKALRSVNQTIARTLKGMDPGNQQAIDEAMLEVDGTKNKSKLGANAILSVSLANARLAAILDQKKLYQYLAKTYDYKINRLPTPLFNVINGGKHADSGLDIQEYFLIPLRGSFAAKVEMAHQVISVLRRSLIAKKYSIGVGDEGGFSPKLKSNKRALRFLAQSVHDAKLRLGRDIALGIDAAASEFFDPEKEVYRLRADKVNYKPAVMYKLYQRWVNTFHLQMIEDGCAEDDFHGWQKLTEHLGSGTLLVGDDLFVTNPQRIQQGIIAGIANTVLIKPNQIGTLTETITAIKLAQRYGYKIVIAHRSGETPDAFISDLAVAVNADFIKAGSLARSERLAKYNRLLEIESQLRS
jgi:enolase